MPLVSIIIPCYKQAGFLPDCIASLQAQSYPHWEAIIINDGSPDNAREIALDLCSKDLRVRYVEQRNRGASAARNSGLRAAKGELIQFLDADDKLESDKLRTQAEFLKLHHEIDIVFGDARYFTTEEPEIREYGFYAYGKKEPWIPALWQATGNTLEKLLIRNLFPINCPLLRCAVFKVVGEWNERLEAVEDWEYWIRCAAANMRIGFYNAPNSFALIRWHAASVTHDSARIDRAALEIRITVGPSIQDPLLKMKNFEKGLDQLRFLNPPDTTKKTIDLLYANLTPKVFLAASQFFICERFWRHYLMNSYKKLMPWPIQKIITNISRRIF